MLESSHHAPETYPVQLWPNGGGTTRQIAADPGQPFRWRLSWATIGINGPFSPFQGYDRSIVIWRGGPVALYHDGQLRTLRAMQPHRFKGESETKAVVDAPAEDFNAFARRGQARIGVYPSYFQAGEDLQFPIAAHEHFLVGVAGEIEILEPNQNKTYLLSSTQSVRITRHDSAEYLNLRARGQSASASCLWVVIRYLEV